ncbi:MAG: type IX secretion system sortase PorU [Ignavibacteria bacterium]|nr:type IX secretion system sortase PorU [Ignavibacteria bacterium]
MTKRINLFFLIVLSCIALRAEIPGVKVLSSNSQSLRLQIRPAMIDSIAKTINGTTYTQLRFAGSRVLNENIGAPEVSQLHIPIGVPSSVGNSAKIISSGIREIAGRLIPVEKFNFSGKASIAESSVYSLNELYPLDLIKFEYRGISRGMQIAYLDINVTRFQPGTSRIQIVTDLIIEIQFGKSTVENGNAIVNDDGFLKKSVINFSAARQWLNTSTALSKTKAVVPSVLSSGKWVRFEAPEEGIYKISYSMLQQMGFSPDAVDPRTIKIYNNGGIDLPERVTAKRPQDLAENAIYVEGESSGKFGSNDYILFYGRGINFWSYDTVSQSYIRNRSPYTVHNYYWITTGGSQGKRMAVKPGISSSPVVTTTTSPAFVSHEIDRVNIGKVGRHFYGEAFNENAPNQTFINHLDAIDQTKAAYYTVSLINTSSAEALNSSGKWNQLDYWVDVNNVNIETNYMNGTTGDDFFRESTINKRSYLGDFPNEISNLKIRTQADAPGLTVYLDYYEIQYTRNLKSLDDNLTIFSPLTSGTVEYDMSNFSTVSVKLFDVTDFSNVSYTSIQQSNGIYKFLAAENGKMSSKYMVLTDANVKTPVNFTLMANQDIHSYSDGVPYIIITAAAFKDQAERLRAYRANTSPNPIQGKVFTVEDIYNEFGGGALQPSAIRDFLRYAYVNWTIKPKYILLLGDGTFDYKAIEGKVTNFVPAFETDESGNDIYCYASDDYYSCIDGDDDVMDVAVGRLNVNTVSEATVVVDKIIAYENNKDLGEWRNHITLVADDRDGSGSSFEVTHTSDSEGIFKQIDKSINVKKLYFALYPLVSSSAGIRKPAATDDLIKTTSKGTLLLSYFGHGLPELWSSEHVLERDVTIPLMKGENYFFCTAATCSFGEFDQTGFQSGIEAMVLKADGGAIGGITASRKVFPDDNLGFFSIFYREISDERDLSNVPNPIGDAFLTSKIGANYGGNAKLLLFCDPALRLLLPSYSGQWDTCNGQAMNKNVVVKALSKMSVSGRVMNGRGIVDTTFTGDGTVTIYDGTQSMVVPDLGYIIDQPGGIIYKGKSTIKKGAFGIQFVVPKDISQSATSGKIVFNYSDNNRANGLVFANNVIFSGTDTTSNDQKGPAVQLAINNEEGKSDYIVNSSPQMFVNVSDETGVNTTGMGVGHRMQAILNHNELNPIDLSEYFVADQNSNGRKGTIKYQFSDLQPGEYSLTVNVFDVFNNKGSANTNFKVVADNTPLNGLVYNYPNPFNSTTTFFIEQTNLNAVTAKIKIFTVAGRLVAELSQSSVNSGKITIPWNGTDNDGNMLANGVYLYKVIITPVTSGSVSATLGKLVIMR